MVTEKKKTFFFEKLTDGTYQLKRDHTYYYQVQIIKFIKTVSRRVPAVVINIKLANIIFFNGAVSALLLHERIL